MVSTQAFEDRYVTHRARIGNDMSARLETKSWMLPRLPGPEVVPGIGTVAVRLYLVERQSAIGPIGHLDWHGPQRRQLFVQWTIWFVRVREPDRCRRNG